MLESSGEASKLKVHPFSTYFSLFYFVLNFLYFLSKVIQAWAWIFGRKYMPRLSLDAQKSTIEFKFGYLLFCVFTLIFFFCFFFCKSIARGVAKLEHSQKQMQGRAQVHPVSYFWFMEIFLRKFELQFKILQQKKPSVNLIVQSSTTKLMLSLVGHK